MGRISHVADYIVLRDSPFELSAGGDHEESLLVNLPPDVVFNERAILSYVADPSSGADNLKYEVQYVYTWQGETMDEIVPWRRNITSGTFIGGVKRGLWEVISGGVLRSSDPPFEVPGYDVDPNYGTLTQSVNFLVESGSGTVRFSDVVLWFQRKVAEAPSE